MEVDRTSMNDTEQDTVSSPSTEPAVNWTPLVDNASRLVENLRSLLPWLRLLFARRRAMYRIIGLGLSLFTLIAFLIPNQYQGVARLMPPNSTPDYSSMMQMASGEEEGGLGSLVGASGIASQLLGMNTPGQLFIAVLGSRTVSDHINSRFDLMRVYGTRSSEDARKRLAAASHFDEDSKTGVVTITVDDEDPRRAADLAKAYVDELGAVMVNVSSSSARRERLFLEDRIKLAAADLQQTESEYSRFATQSGALDVPEQARALVGAAANLEGELIAARAELRGLEQMYTAKDVHLQQARARVGELEQQLRRVAGTRQGEDASSSTVLDHMSFSQLPKLNQAWLDLYRRMKIQEAVYTMLTRQYEVARVAEARSIPSVQMLDVPVVPNQRSKPSRLLIVFAGFILSLLCAAAWVIGGELWWRVSDADRRTLAGLVEELRLCTLCRWRAELDTRCHRISGGALSE